MSMYNCGKLIFDENVSTYHMDFNESTHVIVIDYNFFQCISLINKIKIHDSELQCQGRNTL